MTEECVCGLFYWDFRTGLTFGDVRSMMWSGSPDPADWRHKRRNSVLGYWRQLKQEMWAQHCAECLYYDEDDDD